MPKVKMSKWHKVWESVCLMIKGNSQISERRRRISKREMGRSPDLIKESLISVIFT